MAEPAAIRAKAAVNFMLEIWLIESDKEIMRKESLVPVVDEASSSACVKKDLLCWCSLLVSSHTIQQRLN